ncbi:MAG: hypothetical protein KIT84_27735 [Labilithrix sp.]|nr:hypothetical protein [Labilithrix sp.]MCW5814851.1 hypothetical protein [Labilithrix sp.]
MTKTVRLAGALLLLFSAACGANTNAGSTPAVAPGPRPVPAPTPDEEAKLAAAVEKLVAHDRANDWTPVVCAEVARAFEAIGTNAQALYNAALAYQRCADEPRAKARLESALKIDPSLHHARAQLALYQYKADGDADRAIAALSDAVTAARFQNVPALVDLATVQMARGGPRGGEGCKDDLDCAKLNLQRALAIDDAHMPAKNQLALYYLKLAERRAGKGKKANVQELELAALVCAQAIARDPSYAPIHNTAGLVHMALGQVNGAVAEFGAARKLDARFFEAHMNYAAVNLGFRGFAQAEAAYRAAVALRPNDYDAHLGLALALRGPLTGNEPDYARRLDAVQGELDAAKKIDPNRPDAYFNEGILRQEFLTKTGAPKSESIASLERARKSFESFLDRAKGKAEYKDAVTRGDERIKEIDAAIAFLK